MEGNGPETEFNQVKDQNNRLGGATKEMGSKFGVLNGLEEVGDPKHTIGKL